MILQKMQEAAIVARLLLCLLRRNGKQCKLSGKQKLGARMLMEWINGGGVATGKLQGSQPLT